MQSISYNAMPLINDAIMPSMDYKTMSSFNDTIMPSHIDTTMQSFDNTTVQSINDICMSMTTNVTTAKPCKKNHEHVWNKTGVLTVERCESYCQFCAEKGTETFFKYAWHLRRHVHQVHAAHEFDGQLTVAEGWTGAANGNDKTGFRNKKNGNNGNSTNTARKAKKASKRADTPYTPASQPTTESVVAPPSQAFLPGFDTIDLPADPMMQPVQTFTPPELDFSLPYDLAADAVLEDLFPGEATTLDPRVLDQPSTFENTSPWSSPAAQTLLSALNKVVGDALAAGDFSESQVAFALENYAQVFKAGSGC